MSPPDVLSDGKLRFAFLSRPVDLDPDAMDWTAPGPGAATQLWRMNLHYMEYLEGLDDSLWARLVRSWIACNGAGGPGAWRDSWNSYALSLRIVVWLQELARREGRLPLDLVAETEASTVRQMLFLEDNLETDLGGNHLIKNIKALIWAGTYFDGPPAARWHKKGLALLERELAVQILPDGVHYERSPSYHAQVFADLLECRTALGCDPLGGELDNALARMAQATVDLTHPDGYAAQFNDAGLTMALTPAECLAAFGMLGFAVPMARTRFALGNAGYFGMREDGFYFICDCGPIAPDDLPAHGHGDVLSFEWSVGGRRIIVDQGVYEYFEGPRRAASRCAEQHNTLCLDGADQADFFGAFRCGRRPNVDIVSFEETRNGIAVAGRHDGFAHLRYRPIHTRRFEVVADSVKIVDQIAPASDRLSAVSLLLHPAVTVAAEGDILRLVAGSIEISVEADHPINVLPAVWWPDMGCEYATHRLQILLPAGVTTSQISLRVIKPY